MSFHSFVWPRGPKQAKSIARTLYANHFNWADILIVRGRCFSDHHACFRANRVLENLLWNWDKLKRPYLVYQEGNQTTGDPVPRWFDKTCGYNQFCQCNFVGRINSLGRVRFPGQPGWHYPGSLYINVLHRGHQVAGYGGQQRCKFEQVECPYPDGCNKNTMNELIATKVTRMMIGVLKDRPLSVPPRGVPLPSVLTTRLRKPKVERVHFTRWICRRYGRDAVFGDCIQKRRN